VIDFDNSPAIHNLRLSPGNDCHLPSNFPNDPLMSRLRTFTTGMEGNFYSLSIHAQSAQTRCFHPDLLGTARQALSAA